MRQGSTHLLPALLLGAFLVTPPCRGGEASLPDDRLGIRTAPLLLLSRPDVRADLALDEVQATDANRELVELWLKAQALKGMSGEKAVAARRVIDSEEQVWIDNHLTPRQARRLIQIDLQWEGPSALVKRPIVAETLGLSPVQRASLTAVVDEHIKRRRQRGTLDLTEEKKLTEQAFATLTEPQKQLWKEMLGHPFVPRLATSRPVPTR